MFSGGQTHRGKSQSPVAWVAWVEETKPMKPTDKAILGMVSESPCRNADGATIAGFDPFGLVACGSTPECQPVCRAGRQRRSGVLRRMTTPATRRTWCAQGLENPRQEVEIEPASRWPRPARNTQSPRHGRCGKCENTRAAALLPQRSVTGPSTHGARPSMSMSVLSQPSSLRLSA